MLFLKNSEVEKIIENVKYRDNKCKGRIGSNPSHLFAAILFCFSKFNTTFRNIEDIFNLFNIINLKEIGKILHSLHNEKILYVNLKERIYQRINYLISQQPLFLNI